MDPAAADLAYDLGVRIRAGRLRLGRTQAEIAAAAGISTSTLSRMELGDGAGTPLEVWLRVGQVVAAELFAPGREPKHVYLDALARIVRSSGWRPGGREAGWAVFDRAPHPRPGRPRSLSPPERMVVRVVLTVTQIEVERERLAEIIGDVRARSPVGQAVEGILLVVRTTPTCRRLTRSVWRRSTLGWLSALRWPEVPMPARPGVVWIAPRGTHLLPGS